MRKTFLQTLKLLYAKNGSKKQLILQKWEHFENGQKWLKMARMKSLYPCKLFSLGQKIKLPKTCEKRFHKHIKVVVCKKTARKNTYNCKNESIFKMAKNGHNARV